MFSIFYYGKGVSFIIKGIIYLPTVLSMTSFRHLLYPPLFYLFVHALILDVIQHLNYFLSFSGPFPFIPPFTNNA